MHFIIEFSNGIVQLSSVYNICAIKSVIVLEMKCPQLSKPEATAARNENSIGDRMEKKPWEKPGSGLSRGASSPPARRISSLFQLQQSQSVSGPLVPGVFPRWMSRWRGPHWRSVSGAHLCVLDSADVQGCRGCRGCLSRPNAFLIAYIFKQTRLKNACKWYNLVTTCSGPIW